jgi:hypothetical protein
MSLIARWLRSAQLMLQSYMDEDLRWRLARKDDLSALRHDHALAEQALAAKLKKEALQLAQELEISKARNNTALEMVKIQCQQDLKDYQHYLQSLDKLKTSLRNSYADLPEAVAFTLHHHAKHLLNTMWEAEDLQMKKKLEIQLLEFIAAVHEDSCSSLLQNAKGTLPEKALACIDTDLLD